MRVLFPSRCNCMTLVLAGVLLGGCAYKNPLIEGAAPPQPATVTATAPAPATVIAPTPNTTPATPGTNAAPASAPAAPGQAATAARSDVQTIKEKRRFGFLTPYRTDIQQGNFVSSEMVAQLKPGMTPEQVRFVLGTPLLTDMFHRNRWDYLFNLRSSEGVITRSRLTVFFRDNRLERWEGGNLPTEEDYLARIAGETPLPKKAQDGAPSARRPTSTANESR